MYKPLFSLFFLMSISTLNNCMVMIPARMAGKPLVKLSQAVLLGSSAKEGYNMHKAEMEGKPQGVMQAGPITAGVFYWTTKISLWTAVAITGGALVKEGANALKGSNEIANTLVTGAESLSNSGMKAASGFGLSQSANLAAEAGVAGGYFAATNPIALTATIPATAAMALSDPKTAPSVTDASKCIAVNLLANGASQAVAATKSFTVWGAIKGAFVGVAASIETASVAAGTAGMALPTP